MQLLEQSLLLALSVTFIHATMWEGMIFGFIRNNNAPSWLRKPVYECLTCMGFWWGTFIYIIFFDQILWDKKLLLTILVSCGICTMIDVFIGIYPIIKLNINGNNE